MLEPERMAKLVHRFLEQPRPEEALIGAGD
jgi:hypothetical protein